MNNAALESNSSTSPHYERTLSAARDAASALAELDQVAKARMLRSMAKALDVNAPTLVPLAAADNALTEVKLRDDLRRATVQLRILADIVSDGSYLGAIIDRADLDSSSDPRPDLRRMLAPTGPVAVLGANSLPFSLGVGGADTASALAAGCPVVAKAPPTQPRLTDYLVQTINEGLRSAGAPVGAFGVVYGRDVGRLLVQDPRVTAVGFTGSITEGRPLANLAATRPCPVPFYGGFGSINPVFVTPAAAATRAGQIAGRFLESLFLGAGQFPTKPGILFIPEHSTIEWLVRMALDEDPLPLLHRGIREEFLEISQDILAHPDVRPVSTSNQDAGNLSVYPAIGATSAEALWRNPDVLLRGCYGPYGLIVTYTSAAELHAGMPNFSGTLTATVHGTDDDTDAAPLFAALGRCAERVIWNDWPTNVAVSGPQYNGVPYPASSSIHTSVGPAAIRRFLRPVTYQAMPEQHLPPTL